MTNVAYFPAPSSVNPPGGENNSLPDMRALAVSHAEGGFHVFRLARGSKKTLAGSHSHLDATNDPEQVYRLWTAGDGSPKDWNIGIRCKGLCVLDFDPGERSLNGLIKDFKDKFGPLPKGTPIVSTPKGGRHAYLCLPEGMRVPNSVGKILPCIDIRGEDGYVVGPGSHTEATPDGKLVTGDYVLQEGLLSAEPPLAPAWLIEAAAGVKSHGDDNSPGKGRGPPPEWADNEHAIIAATKYLTGEAPELGEGERDDGLIKIANRIMDYGVSPDKAGELIAEHWNPIKCFPPVPVEDIMEKARNAARSGNDPIGCRPPAPPVEECFEAVAIDDDWRAGPKAEDGNGDKPTRRRTAWEFMQERKPTVPVIDGLVSAGGLYTLTGATGAGKTGLMLNMALAVAFGRRDLIGRDVEPGCVLYMTAENPNKFRDRLILACLEYGVPEGGLKSGRLQVIGGFATTAEMLAEARAMLAEGAVRLVLVDTLQSYFAGNDSNANAEVLKFVRSFRKITELSGEPAVLIAAHPTKGMTTERLVPYGGGAILNEVDGNFTFTAAPDGKTSKLHWEGKLRESNFEPVLFLIEERSHPALADGKGRLLKLPLLRPGTSQDAVESEGRAKDGKTRILDLLFHGPQPSARTISKATGLSVSTASRHVKGLMQEKLIKKPIEYELTPAGKRRAQALTVAIENWGSTLLIPEEIFK